MSENKILGSKGNQIVELDLDFRKGEKYHVIHSLQKSFLDSNHLLSRIQRKGFHFMISPKERKEIIGIWNNKIFLWNGKFKVSPLKIRGSRPLNICYNSKEDKYFFGEYFSNKERAEVHVYKSENALDWDIAYTFPAGSIRHIHKIIFDSINKDMWILTGDSDNESAIYRTNDNFKTLDNIYSGSQKARAVSIIIDKEKIIIPSDTPLEQNMIRELDLETRNISDTFLLPNSAFHAGVLSQDWEYVTTVAEPSLTNDTTSAYIYIRKKRGNWIQLLSGKQDLFSGISKYLFRYPEFTPCENLEHSDKLVFYCRGIKNLDNTTIVFDMEEIRNYYNAHG